MNARAGFALLSTLAALAILSAGALAAIVEIQSWSRASETRTALTRAHWAATACVEWLRAEFGASRPEIWDASTQRIEGDLVCWIEDLDPTLRRHLTLADSGEIARLVGPERTAALLDWVDPDSDARAGGAEVSWYRERARLHPSNRPLVGLEETRFIARWPDPDDPSTADRFTLLGDGRIDINRAPDEIVRSIGALEPHRLDQILARRAGGSSWENSTELQGIFAAEDSLGDAERALLDRVFVFAPASRHLRITGEDRRPVRSVRVVLHVTVREVSDRLAVTRVEVR